MLIKGGHEEGDALADALIETDNMTSWQGQRIDTTSTHGTGCTLASAIACFLGAGRQPDRSRSSGRATFVRVALYAAPGPGAGRGPDRVRPTSGSTSAPGPRLNQVTLTVNDYAKSVDFYSQLGLKQIVDSPENRLRPLRDRRRRDPLDPGRSGREDLADDRRLSRMRRSRRAGRAARARAASPFEHGPRNQPWMWREARLRDPSGNIIFLYKAGEARRFPPWRIELIHSFAKSASGDSPSLLHRLTSTMPRRCSFKLELDFPQPLAGVDEAGCAPLAGPVVAAACILDRNKFPRGIDDSKNLPLEKREALYASDQKVAAWGVGIATSRRSTASTSTGRGCWR